jgi:hypothetical protein
MSGKLPGRVFDSAPSQFLYVVLAATGNTYWEYYSIYLILYFQRTKQQFSIFFCCLFLCSGILKFSFLFGHSYRPPIFFNHSLFYSFSLFLQFFISIQVYYFGSLLYSSHLNSFAHHFNISNTLPTCLSSSNNFLPYSRLFPNLSLNLLYHLIPP